MNVTLKRYVAYYRVSTKRQGKSGLGLEAQQEAVHRMAQFNGATIIAEYIEVETGKNSARPKLHEAIHRAELTNSTLVVAKLDRLARNSHFTGSLMESGLDFICCDNPHATKFTLQILAAVAEHEAKQISERTKAGLQVAKAKGVKLGSARPGHWDGREHLRDWKRAAAASIVVRQEKAAHRYRTLLPEIKRRREAGETLQSITDWLNSQGFVTKSGMPYKAANVRRIIERYLGVDYLGYPGSKVRPVLAAIA
jgi:DNA invertase Pin-like site-specific DNA recombinase